MKSSYMKSVMLIIFGLFLIHGNINAQQLKENSVKITLSGTSTIHEWDMLSTEGGFSGHIADGKITDIAFVVPIKSLVSGKSAMDRNTYQAMHADDYPNIVFLADEIGTLNGNDEVKGQLLINNVRKNVIFPITVSKEDGGYILQGFTQINMTDFKIEPPLFMMGAVKTGELVSVKFIVSLVDTGVVKHK